MTRVSLALGLLLFISKAALAQETVREQFLAVQKEPEKKDKEKKETKPAVPDLFAQAPPSSAEAPTGLNVHMIGDQGGSFALVTIKVPSLAFVPEPRQVVPIIRTRKIRIPIGGGGFKIGENETVLPGDRAFLTYNYFDNEHGPNQGSELPKTESGPTNVPGLGETFAVVVIPGVPAPRLDINRQTIGFEKSFCCDRFSLGIRIPVFQENGAGGLDIPGFESHDIGDITVIAKYAPWTDLATGYGASIGLAVTIPTGPDVPTPQGNIHPTILQPFVGTQLGWNQFVFYGFTSIGVPIDHRDVARIFNDVGLGYRLWENCDSDNWLRSVVPVVEAHVTTPVNHRSDGDVIQGFDLVVITTGAHIGVGRRSLLTLGVATPVTGPRPYSVEGICQFNLRF